MLQIKKQAIKMKNPVLEDAIAKISEMFLLEKVAHSDLNNQHLMQKNENKELKEKVEAQQSEIQNQDSQIKTLERQITLLKD